jgi:hypothetical protein
VIQPQIKCDVCGRAKQEANHWLVAFTQPQVSGVTFCSAEYRDIAPKKLLKIEDICGEACAHTRLSQFLSSLYPANERQSA